MVLIGERDGDGAGRYRAAVDRLADGNRRAAMGRALRELAVPHAAWDIYKTLMSLLK